MRLLGLAVCAVALGCSSNSFDIAETPDTGDAAVVDSGVVTNDSAGIDSSAPPPDAIVEGGPIVDTGKPPLDTAIDTATPVDTGKVCARSSDCGTTDYCSFAKCGDVTGLCTKLPSGTSLYAPVCACNGITFWNKEHAYATSTAIAHEGPCTNTERVTCTGPGTTCSGYPDSKCVVQLGGAGDCALTPKIGGCWRMPTGTSCAGDVGGPMLPCGSSLCMSQCSASKTAASAFYPASCTTT